MSQNDHRIPDTPVSEPGAEIREDRLARRALEEKRDAESAYGGVIILAALAIIALGVFFWSRDHRTNTNVTENSPRVERPTAPTTPPAIKPTPAQPQPPQ